MLTNHQQIFIIKKGKRITNMIFCIKFVPLNHQYQFEGNPIEFHLAETVE